MKEIYLIKSLPDENYDSFRQRITGIATKLMRDFKTAYLKFSITTKLPPAIAVIPFKKTKIAAISVWKENEIAIDPQYFQGGFYGSYKVQEAIPVAYEKYWKDGEPTPGVCLLTLFRRKKGIDFSTFIDRWHNSHTPLSLRIHPLWNYVRNVVEKSLNDRSTPFEGIVEENFRTASDLLNPFRFFGNPLIIIFRMLKVYTDTKAFIDYPSMETYLTTEYHIKS